MCTALSFTATNHYFGRNLDIDVSYNEEVCVMPRLFPLKFKFMEENTNHYALIGIAAVVGGTPLFFDAANEFGLSMAGLDFPYNAYYHKQEKDKDNIAPFEFIPWILGQCKTIGDAKELLKKINICDISFSESLPNSPLHWIVCDKMGALTVESMKDGLHIYENSVGVLTNNPPFPHHIKNLENYKHLKTDNSNIERYENLPYSTFSYGLGAVGLPGDVSSMSRFVRIVFSKQNSVKPETEAESVGQFFHLLSSVEKIKGVCKTDRETLNSTTYSSCINLENGIYYYTTYSNRQITGVNMYNTDLNSNTISRFPLKNEQNIFKQN